jgi:hypothetical protein
VAAFFTEATNQRAFGFSHSPHQFFQKPQLTAAFQKPRLNQTGPKNCSDNAPITNDLIPAVTPFIIPTGN